MDNLSLSFAQEAALRQIDDCTNIHELKALAKSLMKSHFSTRSFIANLLLRDLPKASDYLRHLSPELEEGAEAPPWRQG
jgi:23S rRNA A1618 N6-methylase RlmF